MKLSQLAGYSDDVPEISLRYEAWIMREEPYSDAAVAFIGREMQSVGRDRRGHFSASSLGSCARQQQFTYVGMPKREETAQRKAVLVNGKWMHMKMQAAGLTEGFLPHVEVPISENIWGIRGTMDGKSDKNKIVEAKSQNSFGFRKLRTSPEAKDEHIFQVGTYMLMEDKEEAIVWYENKDNQDTKEFTVHRTTALMDRVIQRVEKLIEITEAGRLADMLPLCMEKKGWQYDYCAYRDVCPLMKTLNQAKETADANPITKH